jgi:DNA mismatch repair ATPase MutS
MLYSNDVPTPDRSASQKAMANATPAMRQYFDAKRQYRDAIVFFRMGDFYEMFYEDALVASRALDLTLTSRSKDADGGSIPMCGIPYHAAEGYLARLVKKGFRVAICEQVEDPRKAKGLVRRDVVRVVSPGTFTEGGYLEAREPAFLMAVAPVGWPDAGTPIANLPPANQVPAKAKAEEAVIGVALLDLSTGEFLTAEYRGRDGLQALADEMGVLRPRELVVPAELALDDLLPATRGAPHRSRAWMAGPSTSTARAASCSDSCTPTRSRASASKGIRRRCGRPAPWCTTCRIRRRPNCRTYGVSLSKSTRTVSSSTPSP